MFEKTLTDVVKGIRASKRDTALYISQCIAEIKTEINSSDMFVKANALQKLTFLQMMGYSMNWASFATIEVMSSSRFAHKRIGYLAAAQGFTQDTEVILLTTNLLQKELAGAVGGGMLGVYEAGLAINCLSNIVTEDLARDLLPVLTNLLSHPQPYLRKKAALCLFKLFIKYPQGLRLTFGKLQELLHDSNSSVVSCAVNVVTELSDKNPKNYLHLAPSFFQLLTSSNNNWMLIKVVKLLGSLVPEEPRLARKLLEPLADIVKKTQAKSLLFEAVYTITLCLPYCRKSDGSMPESVPGLVVLCAQTLGEYASDKDQNLKYLGLVGFASLMQSHPRVLSASEYRPTILACLSDEDVTIRTRALSLLSGMASRKNLVELVSQLLKHVERATGSYKHDLVEKIVDLCSGEKYSLLQDFEWYFEILLMLGHMRGAEKHANLLRTQITEVALRVLPVREFAVKRSMDVLLEGEGTASDDLYGDNGRGKHIMPEILPALAWIVGEYSDLIDNAIQSTENEYEYNEKSIGPYHSLVQTLTNPWNSMKLPTSTQKIYIQNAFKVFAAVSASSTARDAELEACLLCIRKNLSVFVQSVDVEVVERSYSLLKMLDGLSLISDTLGQSPGLIPADEDSSNEEDLLGMTGTAVKQTQDKKPSSSGSLAKRIRGASQFLTYALKPSPMKPSGSKAQKKKRQSPQNVQCDLDKPLDLSVIQQYVDNEVQDRARSRLTLDAVSFTQQTPLKTEDRSSSQTKPHMDFVSSETYNAQMQTEASSSFQNPQMMTVASTQRERRGDPFYLDSASASDEEGKVADTNRFGTIQLLDSDDEGQESGKRRKKKKERKNKTKQKEENFWGGLGEQVPASAVTIYDSDEDDSERQLQGQRRPNGKEFAGLAKVDLTTPLREDEVMPERKHREVPVRKEQKKETKKSKKKKKKKSAKDDIPPVSATGGVGDLLDLGFGVEQNTPAAPVATPSALNDINPINAAFDDLLSLSSPSTPAAPRAVASSFSDIPPKISSSSRSHRPWIGVSLKSSSGTASIDWSAIALAFQVHKSKASRGSVSISIKLVNNTSTSLSDVSCRFKDGSGTNVGNVGPRDATESDKFGEYSFQDEESSIELKGILTANSGNVPVKIRIPPSIFLTPEENLDIEEVVRQFGSMPWTSSSSKLSITAALGFDSVKDRVSSFFRASEVSGSTSSDACTFASKSSSGALVRVLLKQKNGQCKVDVKSTSAKLAESLASEVKKLILQ